MKKSLIISEANNIAALMENDRVVEFFVNRGELLLGDVYVAIVENILPGIDAAFVNLGKDKMGFLHANDVPGEGPLRERLVPKQKLLVQITKEPTGHKGPRVSTAISLPGRFLVLVPEERGISISRRISESKERARLKSVVTLMKPPGVGIIIRTEAKGQNEASLFEDFEILWDRWQTIVSEGEASIGPKLVYRDQDLLYRVIRDAYSTDISDIIVDSADGQRRAQEFMSGWAGRTTRVSCHTGDEPLVLAKGIDKEIGLSLSDRVDLPSGGHLNIQPTEALTVIDVNSGRFTSSRTQAETVRRTNVEAAQEISRQLRLRNIGGMVIVDFIDMESRKDQQQVLEVFNRSIEDDRAKPQVGQMSDLGLVELTRRRQGQSLREIFTVSCPQCMGQGVVPIVEVGNGKKPAAEEERRFSTLRKTPANKPLRFASTLGGRIQRVEDFSPEDMDEEIDAENDVDEDLPEEILQQMPEDLFEQEAKQNALLEEAGIEDFEDSATSVTQYKSIETKEPAQPDSTTNRYYRQANLSNASKDTPEIETKRSDDNQEEIEISNVNDIVEAVEVAVNETTSGASADSSGSFYQDIKQQEPELEASDSTEIDPVTGIYRLRIKKEDSSHEDAPKPVVSFDAGAYLNATTNNNTLPSWSFNEASPEPGYEPKAEAVFPQLEINSTEPGTADNGAQKLFSWQMNSTPEQLSLPFSDEAATDEAAGENSKAYSDEVTEQAESSSESVSETEERLPEEEPKATWSWSSQSD